MRKVRRVPELRGIAALEELNKVRRDVLRLVAGLIFHATVTAAPAVVATAVDLPTSIARLNAIRAAAIVHLASACDATSGEGAHIAADATNAITSPVATNLATAQTLANEIKTKFEAHRVLLTAHPKADTAHAIAAADASDLATLITLVNELGDDIAAHIAAGFSSRAIKVVAA